MGPSSESNGSSSRLSIDLNKVDPHKLNVLDQRLLPEGGIESSFGTPSRSHPSMISPANANAMAMGIGDTVSRLTDADADGSMIEGGCDGSSLSSSLAGAVSFENNDNQDHDHDDASHVATSNASCQTVKHGNINVNINAKVATASSSSCNNNNNRSKKEAGGTKFGKIATTATTAAAAGSNKKKNTPSKRPVSAIGDRHHVTPTNRSNKRGNGGGGVIGGSESFNAGSSQKKMKAKQLNHGNNTNTKAAVATEGAADGNSKSGVYHANNNNANTNTNANAINHNNMNTTVESSRDGGLPKQPPLSPKPESSRDLFSYFPTSSSTSNQGGGTMSLSVASRSQLSSPPALQSKAAAEKNKEKMGNTQRTLHSFLGISDTNKSSNKQQQQQQQQQKDGSIASGEGNGEGKGRSFSVDGDEGNNSKKQSGGKVGNVVGKDGGDAGVGAKPAAAASSKKKRAKLNSSSTNNSTTNAAAALEQEFKRMQHQLSTLQKQLDDANARNASIRNNQTLIGSQLQRQLKHQKAELENVQKENEIRTNKSMEVMERLVQQESVREGKDLRQKLASDGARLGRLVSTRVGHSQFHRSQMIESWEDGHAPKQLKERRRELRGKREGLERRREELMRRSATASTTLSSATSSITSNIADPLLLDGMESSTATLTDSCATTTETSSEDYSSSSMLNTELDKMEAHETARMHLDEITQQERDIDNEERALNIEKRKHVRSLKLVGNEDSSKFRLQRKLHDRYVLMNLLGKGGFSEVWRAFDLQDMRNVAVKIHQLESSWSDAKKENYTKHVSREYEIHRDVRHPRIVSLFDVFEIDTDSFATVLECCKGTDLDTLLKDKGRLPERDARAILMQILSGMRYLSTPSADGQRQGIIHYDLKPGNILFDEGGNAKITDFGLSKIVDNGDGDGGDSMELTSQGAGTYWYLPPECFLLDQDVRISNKVDVWSIGVIYYQMLFGRRPFGDGQSQDHILRNQVMLNATEVNFPSKPTISDGGKEFIRACLTYDQLSRPNISQVCEHGYLKITM